MIDSGLSKAGARLLTLFDLVRDGSLGGGLGADLVQDGAPAPDVAADLVPNVAADFLQAAASVAGDAPTIAADGPAAPPSVAADINQARV